MKCIKVVGGVDCRYCNSETIKFGKVGAIQRYRCKTCGKIQLSSYKKLAYAVDVNPSIAAHVKEGCGIRNYSKTVKYFSRNSYQQDTKNSG